jgi:hypothetical protein
LLFVLSTLSSSTWWCNYWMTTKDNRQSRLRRKQSPKYYRQESHSWIDIIPGYITLKQELRGEGETT